MTWRHFAVAGFVLAILAGFLIAPSGMAAEAGLMVSIALAAGLTALGVIDIYTLRLPDPLTFILIAAGLLLAGLDGWGPFANALIGAVAGYGLIWGLRELWLRVRGEDGIGLGDAKLLAGAGAWTGWVGLPQILLLASGIALACVALGKLSRLMKSENPRLPFGPFLALGLWLVWRTGGLLEHLLIV